MHYKAPDNSLHFLDDDSFAHILPAGCVQITKEEAEAIIEANKPIPTAKEKLELLDAENALTQRNLRETVMLMNEAFKQLSGGALDLSQIPGVAMVYAVEAQAAELRAQL